MECSSSRLLSNITWTPVLSHQEFMTTHDRMMTDQLEFTGVHIYYSDLTDRQYRWMNAIWMYDVNREIYSWLSLKHMGMCNCVSMWPFLCAFKPFCLKCKFLNDTIFSRKICFVGHTNVWYACMYYQPSSVLFLLQQVLSSSPHPHLFDDLLVQTGSLILQFGPSSLGERVTTLR